MVNNSGQILPKGPAVSRGDSDADDNASIEWTAENGLDNRLSARVRERGERGLVVTAKQAPSDGTLVSVRDKQGVYRAVVQSSRPRFGLFEVELIYTNEGRRREGRQPTRGPASVSWDTAARSRSNAIDAEVINISDSGLQVSVAEPIPIGALVRVFGETFDCMGKARYSQKASGRYHVGVEFVRPPLDHLSATDQTS